jgi:transcriptional repressor NF-X1
LGCGYHRCDRLCHGNECGPCTNQCGKPQKGCRHPCPQPCHAPAACPEDVPCNFTVSVQCDCGRITQSVSCHKSKGPAPKCTSECAVRKRNQRLADALGIDPQRTTSGGTEYTEELVNFARRNIKFVGVVESTLAT